MEPADISNRSTASHDRYFEENYETIRRWALQVTANDRDLGDDLVHDLYLKVVQRKRDFVDVDSERGYLYVALKNAHMSHLRRKIRSARTQLPLSDNEIAEQDELVFDPRETNAAANELRAICEYACGRKAKSISASVVILRFFHGYHPAEVAQVINRPINTIEVRLRLARLETRRYVDHLRDADEISAEAPSGQHEILNELRTMVFSSVTDRCLSAETLDRLYKKAQRKMDREELSHVVSCPRCLDAINDRLEIPKLGDRDPLDMIGIRQRKPRPRSIGHAAQLLLGLVSSAIYKIGSALIEY